MKFGLPEESLKKIKQAINKFPEIEQAIIFGSRAMGNYRKGSDVDIAICGKNINHIIENRLSSLLNEELPLPYFFDVVDYTHLTHTKLTAHIKEFGKPI
jgi:predicted nucleotidyltransferase